LLLSRTVDERADSMARPVVVVFAAFYLRFLER
jgi:hypothetical protein